MKLSFKPYKRRLKTPIKMSRGIIDFREGIILRLETVDSIAYSEVVVLDYFKTESLEESLKILASLPAKINAQDLQLIPQDYLATRFAFEALFLSLLLIEKCQFQNYCLLVVLQYLN